MLENRFLFTAGGWFYNCVAIYFDFCFVYWI